MLCFPCVTLWLRGAGQKFSPACRCCPRHTAPSPLSAFYEQKLAKIFSVRLKNVLSQEEKEAKPAAVSHRGCPGRLGCGCWMHSTVHP